MLVSDSPELLTGLGRVCRDLAGLLCSMEGRFRVAVAGMGGSGRRKFCWTQYSFPDNGQFGCDVIPQFWNDFAGNEPGIIMSLWDLSRMMYFGQPQGLPEPLARFYGAGRNFLKVGYVPVDSTGPDEFGLPRGTHATALGYDRLLAASEWGAGVLNYTLRRPDIDWIPHMVWTDKFRPIPNAKNLLGWSGDNVYLGANMANQSRKDWPVAFECAALLKRDFGNRFRFWFHTDVLVRYWSAYELAADYDIQDCMEITTELTDDQLALRYSACDCTILPSASEGFGLPIAESMACGTPCVVTDYAAGQELVEADCRVFPVAYRVDTIHAVRRAVLSAYGFASRAKAQIENKQNDWIGTTEKMVARVSHLDANKLQYPWRKWFLEGIGQ